MMINLGAEESDFTRRRTLQVLGAGALTGLATPAAATGQDRVFVRPEQSQSQAERAVRDHGGTVRMTYDNFEFIAATIPSDRRRELEQDRRVENVEDDGKVKAIACSDHPSETLWWGVDKIDADKVSVTGTGVDVAILDTGLDKDHCDLKNNIKGGHNCTTGPSSKWDDGNGHGSHCGGIAAAEDNSIGVRGTAPGANLYGVKVLKNNGSGSWSNVVCGIDWCMTNGKEIMSMSFGADSMPSDVKSAIHDAYDRGHLMVAAAGNDGNDGGCAGNVGQPARHPDVIAVSAIGKNDGLAGYSSTGSAVELAAPGGADTDDDGSRENPEGIYSTVDSNEYDYYFGTSMACPHVTGSAALVAEAYGGMALEDSTDSDDSDNDNDDIRAALNNNAEDIGLRACQQGNGLVDAEASVNAVSSGNDSPSVSWQNPTDGETVSGTISLKVKASDSDGSVSKVEFYVDGSYVKDLTDGDGDGVYTESWDSTGVSDGDHTLTAEATDDDGASSSASISVTVDNDSSSSSAPTIDTNNVSEAGSPNPHLEVTIEWGVSDSDGDLTKVVTSVTDSDGEAFGDSITHSVSGSSASGTDEYKFTHQDGETADVRIYVEDSAGNYDEYTTTVTE